MKRFPERSHKTLEQKIIDGGFASNDSQIILPKNSSSELASFNQREAQIAYDQTLGRVVVSNGSSYSPIVEASPTFDSLTLEGPLVSTLEYDEVDSFQSVAADLELASDAGSDDGTDPSFLSPMMGNLLGDSVQGEGNYLGGLIGAISLTSPASDYPSGGVLGIVMDGCTDIDGAVVAVIDGSDPSAETRARAAFAVRMLNNNAASGVDYGVDLKDEGSPHYSGGGEPFTVDKAEIRTSQDVCLLNGSGAPVDGTTGDDFAGPGSLYIDIAAGTIYINTGTISASVWVQLATVP